MTRIVTLTLCNAPAEVGRMLDQFEAFAACNQISAAPAAEIALALDEVVFNVVNYAWTDARRQRSACPSASRIAASRLGWSMTAWRMTRPRARPRRFPASWRIGRSAVLGSISRARWSISWNTAVKTGSTV